ncbi:MAG: DUF5667 domain-containing protein, partial [Anaerolineales bacterium]|nr:DUF5667 domain-containing protein [Anaerolineales bacterium]
MNREFDEALQSCLDLMRGGQETIDSVVARYPEYAEELRAQLEIATWLTSASSALDPRPGFVSASRHRLVSRIQQESRPTIAAPLTWGERFQQYFSAQTLAPVAFVFVLMLALFVSGTVVSASKKARRGDDLYSVKRTLEQIALAASLDDKGDAKLSIQMVENRLTEAQTLISEQSYEEVAETIQDSTDQISKTLEIIQTVGEDDRFLARDLASQLDGILAEQKTILLVLSQNAPDTISANVYRVWFASEVVKLTVKNIAGIVHPPPAPPPTAVPTVAPTSTPRPIPTLAPTHPPAPTPTKTRKPPTAVPPTNTPLPTNTPVPPTDTPVPTNTPVP